MRLQQQKYNIMSFVKYLCVQRTPTREYNTSDVRTYYYIIMIDDSVYSTYKRRSNQIFQRVFKFKQA